MRAKISLLLMAALLVVSCVKFKDRELRLKDHIKKHCGLVLEYTIDADKIENDYKTKKVLKLCGPYVKKLKAFGAKIDVEF